MSNSPAVIFFLSIISSNSYGDNSEHWNDLGISCKMNERTTVTFSNRNKFSDIPFRDIYIASAKLGIGYKTKCGVSITPSYRIDWIDRKTDDEYEHRYSLQLDYKKPVLNFDATLTQISELRYFTEASEDHIRLRLRLNMARGVGSMIRRQASVYLMPEIFYDDIRDDLTRFRLYSGFDLKLRGNISLRIGYIFQNDKDKPDAHLFNTGLSWNIR